MRRSTSTALLLCAFAGTGAADDAPAVAPAKTVADATPVADEPAVAQTAPPIFVPWQRARLQVEVEVYTQARLTNREGDDLSELRLDRGELGGRIRLGAQAAAELRIETIRSAQDGGSLGIEGNATVFRLKTAQLVGTQALGAVQLEGALGFVSDPWIRTVEDEYVIKPLSRSASERLLGWPVSDLSAVARATLGPVRATVAVANGEGQRFPERNTGKTTTGVVEVVPLNGPNLRLAISGVARDGSVGVASIRERRFGGGISVISPWVRLGGEVVQAYGVGDRGDAEGLAIGGWVDGRIVDRVFVAARGATLGFANAGGRLSTFGGAISVEPWREPGATSRGRFRMWLAIDRMTSSGSAMPLPGADAGDATLVMLIASATAPFTLE